MTDTTSEIDRIRARLLKLAAAKGEVSDLIGGYGQLIVDECHHLSATSFEQVARRSKAKYLLGLSATVARKDGHHPITFMQCGPCVIALTRELRLHAAASTTAYAFDRLDFDCRKSGASTCPCPPCTQLLPLMLIATR